MRLLSFRERESIDLSVPGSLSAGDLDALARLEPSLPKGLIVWGRKSLTFGPFCGVLRIDDLTIELLPKTGNAARSRGVLVAMLRATKTLSASPTQNATIHEQRVHLLDQFIIEFCRRVESALTQGAIAQYVRQEDSLPAIRGRVDVIWHLRSSTVDRSRIHCAFDERTIDNEHNRALKFVLHKLRMAATSAQTKGLVAALTHRFDQVADTPTTPKAIESLRFDRLNNRWQVIFERAAWLLRGIFPDVRAGTTEGPGLLFNMERLFERFVGARLRQTWEHAGFGDYEVQLQAPQKYLAPAERAFLLKPDVTILSGGEPIRILDTKWKDLTDGEPLGAVSSEDAYQMATYAMRYGCPTITLIYPSMGRTRGTSATRLQIPGAPNLQVCFVDIDELALSGELPSDLLPTPPHRASA